MIGSAEYLGEGPVRLVPAAEFHLAFLALLTVVFCRDFLTACLTFSRLLSYRLACSLFVRSPSRSFARSLFRSFALSPLHPCAFPSAGRSIRHILTREGPCLEPRGQQQHVASGCCSGSYSRQLLPPPRRAPDGA